MRRYSLVFTMAIAFLCLHAAASGAAEPESAVAAPQETPAAEAQQPAGEPLPVIDPEKRLQFRLSVYGWLSGLTLDVKTEDSESSTDIALSDLIDAMDFAAFVRLEAQRGKWGAFSEVDFIKLSQDAEFRKPRINPFKINADAVVKLSLVELGAIRSFEGKRISFDALLGARYIRLYSDVNLGPLESEETRDWLDPLIGARMRFRLSERWNASLRGDLAGFGAGSELTTNAIAVLTYSISDRYDVGFGYRYMKMEFEKEDQESDLSIYGPVVGVAIRF